MPGLSRVRGLLVFQGVGDLRGDVLVKIASAGHSHGLHASAQSKQRQVTLQTQSYQLQFGVGSRLFGTVEPSPHRFAIVPGVDVEVPSRDHHGADLVQEIWQVFFAGRYQQRLSSRLPNGVDYRCGDPDLSPRWPHPIACAGGTGHRLAVGGSHENQHGATVSCPLARRKSVGGIGVITNPRSRKNRKNPRLVKQLAYVLGEQGQVVSPSDLESLEEVARHFKEREIEVLAINGGDGTAHVALTAFVKIYGDTPLPKIALLRGGTMNTVATGLGIRGRPDGLLGALVRRYHLGEPFAVVERNLLKVGDQVGFLFGNGLVTNFLNVYYTGKEPSPWKAFKLVVRCVFSAIIRGPFIKRITQPMDVRVEIDGQPWIAQRFLALLAGTVANVGLGMRPLLEVVRHPGHVQFMGFACTIMRIGLLLPRARRGVPLNHPEVYTELGKRIVITSDLPMPYTIDGDMYQGDKTLVIEAGPRLEMIVG